MLSSDTWLFLVSVSTSLVLVLSCLHFFPKWKLLDKPKLYGHDRAPVPYGVGIVFWMTLLICSLLFLKIDGRLLSVLIASGLLTAVSFADDYWKLSASLRLFVQALCVSIILLGGVMIPAISNPFGNPFVLDQFLWNFEFFGWLFPIAPLSWFFVLVWVLFVTNAMNWLDGSPGIVSGVSGITCCILFLLASAGSLHVIDQTQLSALALILGGSCLVFFFFDFPPPKLLMGDSGTMFLGFMIAVMAIFSGGKLATTFIVLAFPILDAIWTIGRRLLQKKSPFQGDFQHFHHELLDAGLSKRQVSLFYFSVSLIFGLLSLSLKSQGKFLAMILLFLLMVLIRWWLMKNCSPKNSL